MNATDYRRPRQVAPSSRTTDRYNPWADQNWQAVFETDKVPGAPPPPPPARWQPDFSELSNLAREAHARYATPRRPCSVLPPPKEDKKPDPLDPVLKRGLIAIAGLAVLFAIFHRGGKDGDEPAAPLSTLAPKTDQERRGEADQILASVPNPAPTPNPWVPRAQLVQKAPKIGDWITFHGVPCKGDVTVQLVGTVSSSAELPAQGHWGWAYYDWGAQSYWFWAQPAGVAYPTWIDP